MLVEGLAISVGWSEGWGPQLQRMFKGSLGYVGQGGASREPAVSEGQGAAVAGQEKGKEELAVCEKEGHEKSGHMLRMRRQEVKTPTLVEKIIQKTVKRAARGVTL